MLNMIFLSIIIPHYNLPRELLTRCIKSIFDQRMEPDSYEIIVVDDGSDTPPTWIETAFVAKNIKLITAEHGGLGAARNRGMNEARGRYLLFVDSDDCLQPDSLQEALNLLHDEQPQILRFRYKICTNEKAALEQKKKRAFKHGYTTGGAAFMAKNNLPGSACIYFFTKSLADKHNIRFRTGVYHEDDDFTTKIHFHATSLIACNAVIYNYCQRSDSITGSTRPQTIDKRMNDIFAMLRHMTEFYAARQADASEIQLRGLQRKINMLTVDAILNMLYAGYSAKKISKLCNENLRSMGLYPLPQKKYSVKYRLFRILANNSVGIMLLRIFFQKHQPQKQ